MTKDDRKSHKKESLMTIFFSTSKPQPTNKIPHKKHIVTENDVIIKKAHETREKLSLLQQHTRCAITATIDAAIAASISPPPQSQQQSTQSLRHRRHRLTRCNTQCHRHCNHCANQ
jgi:hypothetical protein